jgi:hypothetical protein
LEERLLEKIPDVAWTMVDLEEASRRANLRKTYGGVKEMLGEIFHDSPQG